MNKARLINCGICGTPFYSQRPRAKYCSNRCKNIAHKESMKQWYKDHKEYKEERPVKCKVCGNEFYSRAYNATYCSDECRKKGRLENCNKWRKTHRLETNEGARRRWRQKKIKMCSEAHDNCLSCDTSDGECRFD